MLHGMENLAKRMSQTREMMAAARQREDDIFKIPISSPAEHVFHPLIEEIKEFQSSLSDEVDLGIITNGSGPVLHISEAYLEDGAIVFDGVTDQGYKARLVQHYTQMSILLVAVPKIGETATRIGF